MQKAIFLTLVMFCSITLCVQRTPDEWISTRTSNFRYGNLIPLLTKRALNDELTGEDVDQLKAEVLAANCDLAALQKKKRKEMQSGVFLRMRADMYFKAADVLCSVPLYIYNKRVTEDARQLTEHFTRAQPLTCQQL